MKTTIERVLLITILILQVLFLGIISAHGENNYDWSDIVQTAIFFAGAVFAGVTLTQSKKINYAKFFAELNNDMLSSKSYKETFENIDHYISDKSKYRQFGEKDIADIVSYLSYFVVIGVMIDRGTLDIKDINEAYAWRFFAAMDNPHIQELELKEYSDYNKQLFRLYYKWNKFREKQPNCKFPIEEKTRLINNPVYTSLLRRGLVP